MSNVAMKVRRHKERFPNLFCADRKCLFRTVARDGSFTPCPKHPERGPVIDLMQALKNSFAEKRPAETKPSIAERVARYRCVRVMSHVIESMTSLREIWEATDLRAGPEENALHIVGVRDDETICFRHTVGGCDADIAVDAERLRLTLEASDESADTHTASAEGR